MRPSLTIAVSLIVTVGLSTFAACTARAQAVPAPPPASTRHPAPTTRVVDVELNSVGPGGGAGPISWVLSLVGDSGCGTASLEHAERRVEVEVCRDGNYAGDVLRFDVDERARRDGKQTGRRTARMTASVAPGRRVVIGEIRTAGAPVLELAARLR